MTLIAYLPAMSGGYIWDDNAYVTQNPALKTVEGLRRIWVDPAVSPQYYPLVFTSFWVEYHLWRLWPVGYHAVNVALHALNAILLWLVLRRLSVRGAWWAAAIFALHPVHVESVAWITERKNVLSGALYLSALLAYLRFAKVSTIPGVRLSDAIVRPWQAYLLAVGLYLGALFSKTVTCSLPAAILLILWWKRKSLGWSEALPVIPMLVIGAAMGLMTVWIEQHHVGAQGEEWTLSLIERSLIAGRALWFYAGKLHWPSQLTFVYPRWHIDAGSWWQWLFPAAALGVFVALWLLRGRIGKGPLAAVLFFASTLVPALGFIDVYPFRYSFVADHFQYLASIGLIGLCPAALSALFQRSSLRIRATGCVAGMVVLAALGTLTWRQGHVYKDLETLWRDTLTKNPSSWMAYNNLGILFFQQNKREEAAAHFSQTLRLKPDHAEAHNNLGVLLAGQGRLQEAIAHYTEALRLKPDYAEAHNGLATILIGQDKLQEAIAHYTEALRIRPTYAEAHYNLGLVLVREGRLEEAIAQYTKALRLKPDYAKAHHSLGLALARQGKLDEAANHFEAARQGATTTFSRASRQAASPETFQGQ
jgi:Flp pilus assembly protein TadD